MVKIKEIAETSSGGTPLSSKNEYYANGHIPWINSGEVKQGIITSTTNKITQLGLDNSSAKIFPVNTVLVAMYGATAGQVGILGIEASTNQAICGILPNNSFKSKYLFYFLNTQLENFLSMRVGVARLNLSQDVIKNYKIPLPPIEVQQKIVEESEVIEQEILKAKRTIDQAKNEIEMKIVNIADKGYENKKLSEISKINPSKREIKDLDEDTIVSFVEMASVSDEGFIALKIDKPLKHLKGSYTYFAENDIIIAKITPCMENGKCALAVGLTNHIGMGSSEFHVIRVSDEVMSKFVFLLLNRQLVRKEAEQNMTGSSGHRRVPAKFYENYKIPIPPIEKQKKLIAEIEALEQQIAQAQAIIDGAAERKQTIMQKYL